MKANIEYVLSQIQIALVMLENNNPAVAKMYLENANTSILKSNRLDPNEANESEG